MDTLVQYFKIFIYILFRPSQLGKDMLSKPSLIHAVGFALTCLTGSWLILSETGVPPFKVTADSLLFGIFRNELRRAYTNPAHSIYWPGKMADDIEYFYHPERSLIGTTAIDKVFVLQKMYNDYPNYKPWETNTFSFSNRTSYFLHHWFLDELTDVGNFGNHIDKYRLPGDSPLQGILEHDVGVRYAADLLPFFEAQKPELLPDVKEILKSEENPSLSVQIINELFLCLLLFFTSIPTYLVVRKFFNYRQTLALFSFLFGVAVFWQNVSFAVLAACTDMWFLFIWPISRLVPFIVMQYFFLHFTPSIFETTKLKSFIAGNLLLVCTYFAASSLIDPLWELSRRMESLP